MKKEKTIIRNHVSSLRRGRGIAALVCLPAAFLLFLTGCTVKDVASPVRSFFAREAAAETEAGSPENELLSSAVRDSAGNPLLNAEGEPMTVLSVRELATGGELRINQNGELETYPLGEVMTYTPGSAVTGADGTEETYAGGEAVLDVLGFQEKDADGTPATRAAGETVTHGSDDIVYDENGEPLRYSGEPCTYGAGEIKYDTNGEEVTYPVSVQKDLNGEIMTDTSGDPLLGAIEIVTNENGDPFADENGEAATRQLDPAEPVKLIDQPVAEGAYYINSKTSPYLYFSGSVTEVTESVRDEATGESEDESEEAEPEQTEEVDSVQNTFTSVSMELPGDSLPFFDVRIDLEGYAIFVLQDTDLALAYADDLKDGTGITLRTMDKIPYAQYKYWDDPKFTVSDDQKWVIREAGDGCYRICSAVDESYVMTLMEQEDQVPALVLHKDDGSEQQLFRFVDGMPSIPRYVEEGDYYIRNGLSNNMMLSLGDGNYEDGREAYLYLSDLGDGQVMHISYDDYGYATISHGDSTKVLSVSESLARDNQPVIQYEADGDLWQKWILEPNPEDDEGYFIRSALNPAKVMNLVDGWAMNTNPIQLYQGYDNYAQYWFFETEAIPHGDEFESMDAYAQHFNSATEYLIMVSNTLNRVGIYQGEKGNWTNLYYWECVTGKASTPTVKGEFTIFKKQHGFNGNTDSPVWYTCYYCSSFYPAYFFHSIIYYQGTWDILDGSMGYSGSHGCVRLYTDRAQWIFENIPLETRVVSY